MAHNIEKLDVYKRMHSVGVDICKCLRTLPKEERYGLVSQMKRAAVSVNSNLMEGGYRSTSGEYKHFVGIARGSAAELKYQVIISKDLGYISIEQADKFINELEQICRMLTGLYNKL